MFNISLDKCPQTAASFLFFKDDQKYKTEKPYYFTGPLDPEHEHERTNFAYHRLDGIPAYDIRENSSQLKFEEHGVEILHHATKAAMRAPWVDLPIDDYIAETAALLQHKFGALAVFPYNYKLLIIVRFRLNDHNGTSLGIDGESLFGAENAPHIDQTSTGAPLRLKRHMTQHELDTYFDGCYRLRIVNVWRPLYHTVENAPLAMCDRQSISEEDLVAADRIIPEYAGEIYYLKHNPKHRWFWLSNQTVDEALLFLSYDSALQKEDKFWGTPHASFNLPVLSEQQRRQSVEVRLIIVNAV